MKITTIRGDMCNVHIIISNIVVIVDAGASINKIIDEIGNENIAAIVLTHAHYDHFAYLNDYVKTFKNAKVYMTREAFEKLDNPILTVANLFNVDKLNKISESCVKFVEDGTTIDKLENENHFILLKGHTDCSCGLIVEDNLFCGDALFENGFGRYDLPTSDFNETGKTLQKIKRLKGIHTCYAGHGNSFEFSKRFKFSDN